jgi:hypothetical protein
MGINGHTVNFRPELYGQVCRLVRDYHPMEWDTGPDTNYRRDFPFARNRVSWEQVYGSWKTSGFRTDACLMFEIHKPDAWNDLAVDTHRCGKIFAENFGPTSKLALVESVEIGNDLGKYSDKDYRIVFENMAKGAREGDPKLKIATCNVNVGKSGDYHKSVDCVQGLESLYDVLNVHSCAILEEWPTWKRSYPEDATLPKFMRDIDELVTWRDQHAVVKEIWVTEFGWDSSTKSPPPDGDFAKWQGNTDEQQAQWLVRTFLLLATREVDRAYLYLRLKLRQVQGCCMSKSENRRPISSGLASTVFSMSDQDLRLSPCFSGDLISTTVRHSFLGILSINDARLTLPMYP